MFRCRINRFWATLNSCQELHHPVAKEMLIQMMIGGQLELLMDFLFTLFVKRVQNNQREQVLHKYHKELLGELNEKAAAGLE